jgi:magnesium transporter
MEEVTQGLGEQLEELLEQSRLREARELLISSHPSDAAQAITDISPHLREVALRILPASHAAGIVEELPEDVAASALSAMKEEVAAAILSEVPSNVEVDVLQEVPEQKAEAILQKLEKEEAEEARELLEYEEDTAGGLMQTEYIAVPAHLTASETVRFLRAHAGEFADYPAAYLYVVDEEERLLGVLSMRNLLLCEPETPVTQLMNRDLVTVTPETSGEELAKLFRRYHFLAIPVVDAQGHLLGLVTQEEALRYEVEESEADLLQMSGIISGEEIRELPLLPRTLRRLSWLLIKSALNLIVASVVAFHEKTIQAAAALAVIMPVISDLGGVAGSQAIAVSIRELALNRIRPRDFLEVLLKETAVGVLNGLLLGVVLGIATYVYKQNWALSFVATVAIALNTLIAATLGGVMPLVMRRMRIDPAVAAHPLLTLITDSCGFALVLGLGARFVAHMG